MKRLTTIICCVVFMVAGVAIAWDDFSMPGNQNAIAQPVLPTIINTGRLPLDLQLDLDKRLSHETPIKDSVNIRDSIRIIDKVRWKTRYKSVANRTIARDVGEHLTAVTPDSLPHAPTISSTLGREEQPSEIVDTPKVSSIQLTVDGKVVYSRNDNHSGVRGQ